jgi:hypothetical protein
LPKNFGVAFAKGWLKATAYTDLQTESSSSQLDIVGGSFAIVREESLRGCSSIDG